MSEEIALAAADLDAMARLHTELRGPRAVVEQQQREIAAARDKRGTLERAIRAWADMSKHPPMDCEECEDLYRIANGTYTDPLLAELDAARLLETALKEIDHTPVGAYEVTWSNMPEPCESCVEMREIAEKALAEYDKARKARSG